MLEFIRKEFMLLLMSFMPIIELRGAIPYGIALGFNPIHVYITCLIGSILPSPIIILTFRHILKWVKSNKYLYKIGHYIDIKINRKGKNVKKYKMIGLMLFVALPIPSTGVWSGSMIASILKFRIKDALISITIGNIIAGLIVLALSYHLI
ncbi:COG2426 family protein [Alkalithermobacter paradoxus]|uniref:Putative small multi-drug export protein n=1 Tax=Alkalithermobacter paradoxus TaxID=29349 RepID=A0A1V4I7W3_9FIRM|nr:putative small multi-drug export protein [[Clostridium] thermoalcaliphilum]